MKLGNDLRTEQTQKLVMTPTMIQAVKILQLNRQELLEHIREELMDNPVLETSADSGEEHDASAEREERDEHEEHSDLDQLILDFAENSGLDDISYKQNSFSSDRNSMYENLADDRETLQEHLLVQLRLTEQDIAQKWIGEYIIESLDENGMMTSTAEEIATALKTCRILSLKVKVWKSVHHCWMRTALSLRKNLDRKLTMQEWIFCCRSMSYARRNSRTTLRRWYVTRIKCRRI